MEKTPYRSKLTFMDLMIAFMTPRNDHPGKKSGIMCRRGCFNGKICHDTRKKNRPDFLTE